MKMNERFLPRVLTKEGYYYPTFSELGVTYENPDLTFCEENIKTLDWAFGFYLSDGIEFDHILEQCTGLKDKNGKLIYEGDIVKTLNKIGIIKEVCGSLVCYWKGDYPNNNGTYEYLPYFLHNNIELEIIGNIHENLELLK